MGPTSIREYLRRMPAHPVEAKQIVVLESFGPPHDRTNPYSVQLFSSFPDRVDARYFSWSRALRGDYDVFHLHWPEVKVRGVSAWKSLARGSLFLLLLIRIRIGRKALVRTLHDRIPHESPTVLQRWVIDLSERWTTLWITLSSGVEAPAGTRSHLSAIGHFRDWFEPAEESDDPSGVPTADDRTTLLHFGLVRRYKGVDTLVREFQRIDDADLALRIVGTVQDDELAAQIDAAVAADGRISSDDRYVTDIELRDEVLGSTLVVLPFSRITNSSSLLVALSLGRPVLAPDAPSIREVAEEVGDDWVHLYSGDLTAADIEAALEKVRSGSRSDRPDLSRRDWQVIGEEHAVAFELARDIVRSEPGSMLSRLIRKAPIRRGIRRIRP